MIRQAVSCDICGTEKKLTNHWFVSREHSGELRLGGWSSRNRSRAGTKHLCGQICLHKLVDEFMARSISARVQPASSEPVEMDAQAPRTDASLTSFPAHVEAGPASRIAAPAAPFISRSPPGATTQGPIAQGPVALPTHIQIEAANVPPADQPQGYSRRSWRTEAWERERERELRQAGSRPQFASSRHST